MERASAFLTERLLVGLVLVPSTYAAVASGRYVDDVHHDAEEDPAEPRVVLTVWGTGYKAADV